MNKLSYTLGGIEVVSQCAETQKTNKYWTLIYVRSGAGICMLEGRLQGFSDGDLFIIPPRLSYSFVSDDLGEEYNENVKASIMRFSESWLDALLSVFRSCSKVVLRLKEMKSAMSVNGTKWLKVSSLMAELTTSLQQEQPEKILQILDAFSTETDIYPMSRTTDYDDADIAEKVVRIKTYLDCHILNKITLEDISSYTGMNRTYFCLFFKKHFGSSLTDYINSKRVDMAAHRLKDRRGCISEIAHECGFPTVTYFNRIFRKYRGVTPSEYRKSL